ncbi:MAG: hypothetical protein K0S47_3376 [Herbinix sp.]|jgi:hypothetical protein|nr:hypothetical protein [Herbinix sp.]
MNERNHVTEEELLKFQQDIMSQEDTLKFLEHVSSCDFCSARLAESMQEHIMNSPMDLKANILKAINRPDAKLVQKAKETSRQMQLLFYSLKVGAATVGALIALLLVIRSSDFSTMQDFPMSIPKTRENKHSITAILKESSDKLSNNILDFSNSIMNTEVNKNDKKEK